MIPDTPRILVVGYNAFDIIVPVSGFPVPDTKTEVPFIGLGGGGPGATAAVAMARLGARVRLITPLTDDAGGLVQRQELNAAGVDLSGSPVLTGQECAKAVILVQPESGERTIFWSRGKLPLLDADLWDSHWLDGVDLLYLDGHEPDLSLVAARQARARGLPVVLDAGSVRQGSEELVALCTDVISSSVFALQLAGLDDPLVALEELRRRGPERVAMTFGAEGVLALGDPAFVVPAYKVNTVDTTGAGDVFHAGYAFALALGGEFRHNLEFGAATAALKCAHWGGRGGLPLLNDVLEMLKFGETLPVSPRFNLR
jgi:sulfofructose kinase